MNNRDWKKDMVRHIKNARGRVLKTMYFKKPSNQSIAVLRASVKATKQRIRRKHDKILNLIESSAADYQSMEYKKKLIRRRERRRSIQERINYIICSSDDSSDDSFD